MELKLSKLVQLRFCGSIVPALRVELFDYMVDEGGKSAKAWLGRSQKRDILPQLSICTESVIWLQYTFFLSSFFDYFHKIIFDIIYIQSIVQTYTMLDYTTLPPFAKIIQSFILMQKNLEKGLNRVEGGGALSGQYRMLL